ncbi:MAG: aminoacyl-tRNA hydrolase [Gammaproteobacteria bacterium RIFCSPHIGHO2_12_FULL_45_12]|nr:MAG: aminoacyl-tRNA hydrolase [Gammaproteobacteria bacterium RIFCSPHIGHO2_12_FULL_45_12]
MEKQALSHAIQLIVGLANPGQEYTHTRHNAGAWLVENIARSERMTLRPDGKFHGLHCLARLNHQACHLLIPTTFINLSGQAVQACANYLKIPPQQILIVHDDIDLPAGTIKLKFDGGDGGHNGLKDIIRHLNTKKFYRLRIGVGRPGKGKDVVDYVLHPPSKSDRQQIDDAMIPALNALPLLLQGEINKAMQTLHTEPPSTTSE